MQATAPITTYQFIQADNARSIYFIENLSDLRAGHLSPAPENAAPKSAQIFDIEAKALKNVIQNDNAFEAVLVTSSTDALSEDALKDKKRAFDAQKLKKTASIFFPADDKHITSSILFIGNGAQIINTLITLGDENAPIIKKRIKKIFPPAHAA